MDFYFNFVVPNRSLIEIGQTANVNKLILAQLHQYVSTHWERICRKAVPFLNIDNIVFKSASRWWGTPNKESEIEFDVVAESVDKKYLLVGECKWNDTEINQTELTNVLLKKAVQLPFAKKKKIITALFLKTRQDLASEHVYTPQNIIDAFEV